MENGGHPEFRKGTINSRSVMVTGVSTKTVICTKEYKGKESAMFLENETTIRPPATHTMQT